jgi:hypothetical protein
MVETRPETCMKRPTCGGSLRTALALILAWAPNLRAATLTVTNANDDGPGSLRETILVASPGDEILFEASLAGVPIVLSSGELVIDKELVITGLGKNLSILDGNRSGRIFNLGEAANVTLSNLTVQNGWARECLADQRTRSEGGGIYNAGSLQLNQCLVSGNLASHWQSHCREGSLDVPESIRGGGIFSRGTLVINLSEIQGNVCFSDLRGYGGGIYNSGNVAMTDSKSSGNSGNVDRGAGLYGAGIYNDASGSASLLRCQVNSNGPAKAIENLGNLTIANSMLANNTGYRGGAVSNSGTAQISDTTLQNNSAGVLFAVGGIQNLGSLMLLRTTVANGASEEVGGVVNSGVLRVVQSTIANNLGFRGAGGLQSTGTLTVIGSTIAGNRTRHSFGGISLNSGSLKGNVLAGNTNLNDPEMADCDGTMSSLGHNLIGETHSCNGLIGGENGDLAGVDWRSLFEIDSSQIWAVQLANNGGPTPTVALLPESPAIDIVAPDDFTDEQGNPLITDQRGVPRPQGPACDAGAFEFSTPRGKGFWAHQCSDKGFKQINSSDLQALLDTVADTSSVFPELAPAGCEFLQPQNPQNDMRARAQQELLALWLNLASGRITRARPIDLAGLTQAATVTEALSEIELTVSDPLATHADLANAKDVAEAINGGSDDLELVALEPMAGVLPGATRSVTLALVNLSPGNRNYSLVASGSWTVKLSTTRVNALASDQAAQVTLTVTAPAEPQAKFTSIRVTATDLLSPAVLSRDVSVVFKVAGATPKQQAVKSLRVVE